MEKKSFKLDYLKKRRSRISATSIKINTKIKKKKNPSTTKQIKQLSRTYLNNKTEQKKKKERKENQRPEIAGEGGKKNLAGGSRRRNEKKLT